MTFYINLLKTCSPANLILSDEAQRRLIRGLPSKTVEGGKSMTTERKILIVLGVIIIAMAIFGFKNKERYNYSEKNRGPGFNLPSNCTPMEYAVTHTEGIYTSWDKNQKVDQVEGHLNYMGSQGWALVSTQKGSYSDEYVFFFARPTGR